MQAPSAGILASSLEVGSSVYLMENGTAAEYLVVNQGIPGGSGLYDSSCDGTWLLRKDIYSLQRWGNTNQGYQNSTLHSYLTNTFSLLFDAETLGIIKTVKIPYNNTPGSIQSGAKGLSVQFFILGLKETGWIRPDAGTTNLMDGAKLSYFDEGYGADIKRVALYEGAATNWWTRAAFPSYDMRKAYFWATNGAQSYLVDSSSYGVRPALILPSTAKFDKDTMILKG